MRTTYILSVRVVTEVGLLSDVCKHLDVDTANPPIKTDEKFLGSYSWCRNNIYQLSASRKRVSVSRYINFQTMTCDVAGYKNVVSI